MQRLALALAACLPFLLLSGCSLVRPAAGLLPGPRAFDFATDTLAEPIPEAGAAANREPLADPALRGWADAHVARQFFLHARFEPAAQPPTSERRIALVREVLGRSPRAASPEARRIVVPGYANLRELSRLHGHLLRAESWLVCECASRAPLVARAFDTADGVAEVARLNATVAANQPALVQLYRRHQLRYQRALLVLATREGEGAPHFLAYDPAAARQPVELTFNPAEGKFTVSDDTTGAVALRVAH
jgi:hypothetical protein